MSERFQVAVETQLALPEVAFESGHKLTAKDATGCLKCMNFLK